MDKKEEQETKDEIKQKDAPVSAEDAKKEPAKTEEVKADKKDASETEKKEIKTEEIKAEQTAPEKIEDVSEKAETSEADTKELTDIKIGVIGEKLGMTQVFSEDGICMPATVVKVFPGTVLQVKTNESDGYAALKIAFKEVKKDRLNNPLEGVYKKIKINPHKIIREFRVESKGNIQQGDILSIQQFKIGDFVDVQGVSKGKGFQGVVKRHGMKGGKKTHGQSNKWRAPGSIGAGTDPGRVWKGHPMGGRMGHDTKTIQNLIVISINIDKNFLLIKGSVPGPRKSIVRIKPAIKKLAV